MLTNRAVGEAGHGLNLEYDHPTTYAKMLDYLVQNGLAPAEGSCNGGGGWKQGGWKNGRGGRKGRHHG